MVIRLKEQPMKLKVSGLCCVIVIFFALPCFAEEVGFSSEEIEGNSRWELTLFSGVYSNRTFGEATFNIPGEFEKIYMHSLALSRDMAKIWDNFCLELEGMFAKHYGAHKYGHQDYEEYVMALLLRYDNLPWNRVVPTSVAIGEGLSLTSKVPKWEVQNRGQSRRFLNYLTVEFTVSPPQLPQSSLVYRVHHRSGVFGLFGGVKGASDFYLLGLRCKF